VDFRTFSDKIVNVDYQCLLGVQFEYGGRGPEAFDCYGLVSEMHRRADVELPDFRSPKVLAEIAALLAAEKYAWEKIAEKTRGDVIPMSVFEPGHVLEMRMDAHACHVGFVHRKRKFLHTYETSGGVVQNEIVDWRDRILGVYRYRGAA
jgi:cell wall-associated NlpC family hydrolase